MRYADITEFELCNGEGVGVSLFVQGCHFHCDNCFNSETWDFDKGSEWNYNIEKKFLELIGRSYIDRISILGGEPLAAENLNDIFALVNKIRALYGNRKTIWLYTGYVWEKLFPLIVKDELIQEEITRQLIVEQCDIVVDGPYIDNNRDITLKWRGSSNQRVIEVKESIKNNKAILYCN